MMNSRTRRSPPRGRGSSRSSIWKWYQSWGSSLYDRISRACHVNVSSCVIGRMNRRPARSVMWKISGILSRPVASQSSTGVSTGASHSWHPIACSSSRMICSTFRWIVQPIGRYDHSPALTWRTKPPRTSSLWLTASASAGSSRRVGKKSCDALAANSCSLALERDQRSFGHRQRRRLGHLQALWAVHALCDPLVDLVKELVDQDVGGDLLQHAAVGVDEADVTAARDPEV